MPSTRLLVIGIGAGDPEYLTVQAVNALNQVDVFFLLDKGSQVADLAQARTEILQRFRTDDSYRTVEVLDPQRDRTAADYGAAVDTWREERARRIEQAIRTELADGGCGGFLVWGDPALYDGTIRVIESILRDGSLDVDVEVVPGISAVQSLAARHRVTLNRVAGAIQVTTGRRLSQGLPEGVDDIVVMLDADLACARYRGLDLEIFWGAYLGTDDEILVAGKLDDVIDDLTSIRREARERKGWIMDTYLLRRPGY